MGFTLVYEFGNNLYINLTNRCTNSCTFCVRNNTDGINEGIDLWLDREPTGAEIINDIKNYNLKDYQELVFCGYGEPLLKLIEIIEVSKYIRSVSNIKIRINTNGQANMYFKEDITPKLKGLIDVCSISLNASNSQKYQEYCFSEFGEEAFDGLIDFAKKCKINVPSVVFTVVDVLGEEEIKRCENIAREVGIELKVREEIKDEA